LSTPHEGADRNVAAARDGLAQFGNIGAGAERALAGTGHDDGSDRRFGLDEIEKLLNAINQCGIECVELLRSVEADRGDRPMNIDQGRAIAKARSHE
jgi:hypothetical protein